MPDSIYRLCALSSPTPLHIKHEISKHLKGIPDLLIFKGDRFLGLELKRKGAKARQAQKKWMKNLNCKVVDTVKEGIEIIDCFDKEGENETRD